jgi:hypothetical protein
MVDWIVIGVLVAAHLAREAMHRRRLKRKAHP